MHPLSDAPTTPLSRQRPEETCKHTGRTDQDRSESGQSLGLVLIGGATVLQSQNGDPDLESKQMAAVYKKVDRRHSGGQCQVTEGWTQNRSRVYKALTQVKPW